MLLPILRTKTILCFRYVWMFVGLEDTTNTGVDITQSRHLFVSHCYAVHAILFFSMELTFFFWLSFLLNECQPKTAHLLLNEFIHRMGRSQKVWNQQCKHTVLRGILSKDKSRQTQTQITTIIIAAYKFIMKIYYGFHLSFICPQMTITRKKWNLKGVEACKRDIEIQLNMRYCFGLHPSLSYITNMIRCLV